MIQGLYSAATGLEAAGQNQEFIAHNLAHATVSGYRQRGLTFQPFERVINQARGNSPPGPGQGTEVREAYTGFQPGDYYSTGNPLDLALEGEGFFVIQGPEGPLYTRNGSFQLNGDGELQNKEGYTANGEGGPIQIPPSTASIDILDDGSVLADGARVGQLRLVTFKDAQRLIPVGTTLFKAPDDLQPEAANARLVQGFREGSNVSIVNELVNLIAGMRYYEAAARSIRAISESVEQNTRLQR